MGEGSAPGAVVFDLGGVLIDWNPRYLYRKLFEDAGEMEDFLATVCHSAWNLRQDAGRPVAEAAAEAKALHPDKAALIEAYYGRWPEMLNGAIDGTVAILAEIKDQGTPLYALTNWSAETFHHARSRFGFLDWFRAIVVSGDIGMIKPDADIYEFLLATHGLTAAETVFIDDKGENVEAARALGFQGIRFTEPESLRTALAELEVL
ncbi:MAG: HAD family phosphatase [Proteobacteria bacterium]|nr:HAD family phosphatase [Pseudomonadota bacterium]